MERHRFKEKEEEKGWRLLESRRVAAERREKEVGVVVCSKDLQKRGRYGGLREGRGRVWRKIEGVGEKGKREGQLKERKGFQKSRPINEAPVRFVRPAQNVVWPAQI